MEQKTGTFAGTLSREFANYRKVLVRPTGIEPVLRVPETLVISFSLRARSECFSITGSEISQRAIGDALAQPNHFIMNEAIGGQRFVARNSKRLAGKIAEPATGFVDD